VNDEGIVVTIAGKRVRVPRELALAARVAAFIAALGIIGWLLWKLPVAEVIMTAFYAIMICAFVGLALGLVSYETVSALNVGLPTLRAGVARVFKLAADATNQRA
jgi:hypothetical protein